MLELILSVLIASIINVATIYVLMRYKFPALIQTVLDEVGESISGQLQEQFSDPMVKKSMSHLGKLSGDSRQIKAVKNELAQGVLNNVTIAGIPIKMIADYFGFDIDDMMERYGADSVMQAFQSFMPLAQQFTKNIKLPSSLSKKGGLP